MEAAIGLASFIRALYMFHAIICAHDCTTLLSYIVFIQSPVYSDHVWGSLENRTLIRRTTISCPTIERKNPYIYATLLR